MIRPIIRLREPFRGLLYVPFYLTEALGAFEEEGLGVRLETAPSPAEAVAPLRGAFFQHRRHAQARRGGRILPIDLLLNPQTDRLSTGRPGFACENFFVTMMNRHWPCFLALVNISLPPATNPPGKEHRQ